jgi:Cu2+-exporting ATPase
VYATVVERGQVYFDSIAMFVFLLLAARYFEARVHVRAAEVLDRVARLLPAVAMRLTHSAPNERTERIAVADLKPGDRVVVSAGETVPADGIVESGASEVDEALLTGESRAVPKRAGDQLIGGSTKGLVVW